MSRRGEGIWRINIEISGAEESRAEPVGLDPSSAFRRALFCRWRRKKEKEESDGSRDVPGSQMKHDSFKRSKLTCWSENERSAEFLFKALCICETPETEKEVVNKGYLVIFFKNLF